MRLRAAIVVIGVVFMIAVTGCVGVGPGVDDVTDDIPTDDTDDGVDAADDAQTAGAAFDGTRSNAQLARHERDLIHRGEIVIVVNDTAEAAATVREITRDTGGFLEASEHEQHADGDRTWASETIVIRVPSEAFDGTIDELGELGTVERFETETEDVTDELVDLEARLRNLEAERDRLRDLYDEANETDEILAIQGELSAVQEQIERLAAKEHALEEAVTFSTITLHLGDAAPEPHEEPAEPAWYETSVAAAFTDSIEGVVLTLRAGLIATAIIAPYALVFGTPVVGALGFIWHRSRTDSTASEEVDAEEEI